MIPRKITLDSLKLQNAPSEATDPERTESTPSEGLVARRYRETEPAIGPKRSVWHGMDCGSA
jgi:hypothetical protein